MITTRKAYKFFFIVCLCFIFSQCGNNCPLNIVSKSLSQRNIKIPEAAIYIDGMASDWANIEPLVVNVGSKKASANKIDLKSVRVAHDNSNLYILLESGHVGSDTVSININFDYGKSSGVDLHLKGLDAQFQKGWDYVIKLTYSFSATGSPMVISQIEKFIKVKHGYKSELVFKHKNNIEDPSYVGASSDYQELMIPLEILNIKPPAEIVFLFEEGFGGVFAKYGENSQAVIARIE